MMVAGLWASGANGLGKPSAAPAAAHIHSHTRTDPEGSATATASSRETSLPPPGPLPPPTPQHRPGQRLFPARSLGVRVRAPRPRSRSLAPGAGSAPPPQRVLSFFSAPFSRPFLLCGSRHPSSYGRLGLGASEPAEAALHNPLSSLGFYQISGRQEELTDSLWGVWGKGGGVQNARPLGSRAFGMHCVQLTFCLCGACGCSTPGSPMHAIPFPCESLEEVLFASLLFSGDPV